MAADGDERNDSMRTVNADYITEEVEITAGQADKIDVEVVKNIINKAPTVTGVKWNALGDCDQDVPENTLLLISFANFAAVLTGYFEDGVFKTPGDEIFKDYGLVVNAWCVCPQGYESEDL